MQKSPKHFYLLIALTVTIFSVFFVINSFDRKSAEAFNANDYNKSSGQSLMSGDWNRLADDFLPTATSTNLRIVNGLKLRLDGGIPDSGELQLRTNNNGAGNHWAIYDHVADGNLNFWHGSNRFIINTNGNAEVGETTINDKLVVSANNSTEGITLNGLNAPALKLRSNGTKFSLGLATAGGDFISQSSIGDTIFRSENKNISFSTDNGANSLLAITNNGNIGIGVASPSRKLDVLGDIHASGAICDSVGCVSTSGGGDWTKSGTNDIYNTSLGNVGIGLTTAPSQKLEVNGNVKANQFCIGGTCTNKLSHEVVGGGVITGSKNISNPPGGWTMINFAGAYNNSDAGAVGGFVYKLGGVIKASIFYTQTYSEFNVDNTTHCADWFCITSDGAGGINVTGLAMQLEYVVIK